MSVTNGVNLEWYGSYNEINSFKIERAPDDNGAPGDWTEIASIPTSNFPQNFTDSTVQTNTTYWYRVRAFNFFGISDYSDPVSIRHRAASDSAISLRQPLCGTQFT